MKSGAAFLLAILLAIFLAYGSFGSSSSDDNDSDHSNSASSSDDHDDSSNDDDEDKKASDEDDSDKDDSDKDSNDKDSNDEDDSAKDASHANGMKQRLENEGLHVEQSSATSDDHCAAHSFGEVSTYFQEHPCNGLDRAFYVVSDGDNTAIVSVDWVEMPDADSAAELQTLVDRPGTGNLTELSKEDGPYRSVSYSGWYYRSGRDGDTFSSIQAEPLTDSDGSREVARRASGAAGTD